MVEEIIRRIVGAAIESFPIDEKKKLTLLEKMLQKREDKGGENDVLR